MTRQSDFEYVYEADRVGGVVFQIGARADPSTNNPESFAAILFFELADGSRIEVAKVDNAEHDEGEIHLDRFYREIGADIKDFEVPISNLWEAEDHLNEHARTYGQTYLKNHGKGLRDEG
ncbi:hypothetical protein SAMN04488066_104152 [Halorubrum aquaticum]|uniref:DUF7718 domain-containing protein n=1 Tax=Halorubrum aquaticum TaxID=387340 RepID=A0A1I3A5I2_9EURY|nr:hypothetical protein SAMN04488066_104152 [Halorubrum aquaticum]